MRASTPTQTIIHNYLAVLNILSDQEVMLRHYPALVYPQSLLGQQKTIIRQALRDAKEQAFIQKDFTLIQLLDWARDYLDCFIEDAEADALNRRILSKSNYQEALNRHSRVRR